MANKKVTVRETADKTSEASTSEETPSNDQATGQVVLSTRWGRTFKANGDFPVITPEGVEVSVEVAGSILEQARTSRVPITSKNKEA